MSLSYMTVCSLSANRYFHNCGTYCPIYSTNLMKLGQELTHLTPSTLSTCFIHSNSSVDNGTIPSCLRYKVIVQIGQVYLPVRHDLICILNIFHRKTLPTLLLVNFFFFFGLNKSFAGSRQFGKLFEMSTYSTRLKLDFSFRTPAKLFGRSF